MRRANFITVSTLLAAACSLAAAAEFDTVCPLQEKATATYYVAVDFNGHGPEEFMVDTGSSYVMISESTLAMLKGTGQAAFLKQVAGVLADGSKKQAPVYRISSMRVGGCVINDVEAVTLPGATRQILGLSALKKVAPFAVSVNPPRLMLSHCKGASAAVYPVANRGPVAHRQKSRTAFWRSPSEWIELRSIRRASKLPADLIPFSIGG